jgi:shikimate kinase
MTITLTGFMGCGKSSVGRYLSELLCCPFTDLDEAICQKAGKSIPEIFTSEGEECFRRLESEALHSILTPSGAVRMVLALGGGTVMTPECAELVKEKTTCIYLKASIETLIRHLETEASGRPMLQGDSLRSRIEELMSIRSETYETTAHITIETDGKSIEAIAEEIFHILNN